MKPEEEAITLPEWVPQSVARLASATLMQNEIRQRLLSDARMKDVWAYLKRVKVSDAEVRLASFRPDNRLQTWGHDSHDLTINDQLCGAFFLFVLHELSINTFTATRGETDQKAKRWLDAAIVCRETNINFAPFDAKLRESLASVADYLDRMGALIKNEDCPRVLPQSGKNDDLVRSHVRTLAQASKALFGDYGYGILAKTTNVALDLSPELDKRAVEKMCKDLPPYKGV